jgi:hypothetical protein
MRSIFESIVTQFKASRRILVANDGTGWPSCQNAPIVASLDGLGE